MVLLEVVVVIEEVLVVSEEVLPYFRSFDCVLMVTE